MSPKDDLGRFGYAQELFRRMGGFSNFAVSFSIISILTGAVTLYGYGLEMGGPLEMTLGWPIATAFTLILAAGMAELCSAYPTSGAMYHWASALGGAAAGWFVAWFTIFGLLATLAGINYSCAQFILPLLSIPASPQNLWIAFALILLTQGLINHYGVRLVAALNDLSVPVHILGVIAIVAALWIMAPRQPLHFLATAVNSNGRSPYWWAFALGLLQAHWTFTGFDASASLAEETVGAREKAPWGMVLSVAVSGIVGYLLLIGMTLSIRSLPAALSARDLQGNPVPAAIAVFQQALGPAFGNVMAATAAVAMWFCGLSCITSVSRTLYSLARDGGTPSRRLAKAHRLAPRSPHACHLDRHPRRAPRHGLRRRRARRRLLRHRRPLHRLRRPRRPRPPRPLHPSRMDRGSSLDPRAFRRDTQWCCSRLHRRHLLRARHASQRAGRKNFGGTLSDAHTLLSHARPPHLRRTPVDPIDMTTDIDILNPATGEIVGVVPDATPQDIDRAVACARASFEDKRWRGKDPSEKSASSGAGPTSSSRIRMSLPPSNPWRTARPCAKP
jgi:Amino acid transporters